jgi:hypothetical protein
MRSGLGLTVLVVVGAATAVASAASPVVPRNSQLALRHKLPSLAYVPARVPSGFHYYRWATTTRPALRIWFRDKAKHEITFVAVHLVGACSAGHEKTFQLDGNKVYWSHTAEEQQAWRCVVGPSTRPVRLVAATPLAPTRFSDSGLGRVAASGHLVR